MRLLLLRLPLVVDLVLALRVLRMKLLAETISIFLIVVDMV